MFYSIDRDLAECRNIITAKPISPSFEDQVEAAEELFGKQLKFWFTESDIEEIIDSVRNQKLYPEKYLTRVETLLKEQIHLHQKFQIITDITNELSIDQIQEQQRNIDSIER